jgi:hypothetical protein
MVALQGQSIGPVPLSAAVSGLKHVGPTSDAVLTARQLGVSFGD